MILRKLGTYEMSFIEREEIVKSVGKSVQFVAEPQATEMRRLNFEMPTIDDETLKDERE